MLISKLYAIGISICIFSVAVGQSLIAQTRDRPVIFVPGIVGSVLSNNDGEVIWGDRKSLRRSKFRQLDLLPGDADPVELNPTDALREVPLVFGTLGVGVYSELLDFLTSKPKSRLFRSGNELYGNLVEGETLFVFAYDWRRSNFANAVELDKFINTVAPEGKYDLIAHSMGGIITRIMLSGKRPDSPCFTGNGLGLSTAKFQRLCTTVFGPSGTAWPNPDFAAGLTAGDRLHRFLEIAVPHRGSVNVVSSFLEGWGRVSLLLLGGKRGIQDPVLSMVSPYELIPTYDKCCAVGVVFNFGNSEMDDPMSEEVWAEKVLGFGVEPCPYTSCDLKREVLRQGLRNKKKIDEIMTAGLPSHVKSVGILGRGVKNSMDTFYVSRNSQGDGDKITFRPTSDGDGTVFRLSALAPEDEDRFVTVMNKSHPFIFADSFAEQYIYNNLLKPAGEPIKAVTFSGGEEFAGGVVGALSLEPETPVAFVHDDIIVNFAISDIPGRKFDVDQLHSKDLTLKLYKWGTEDEVQNLVMTFNEEASLINVAQGFETNYVFESAVGALSDPDVYKLRLMDGDTEVAVSFIHIVEASDD